MGRRAHEEERPGRHPSAERRGEDLRAEHRPHHLRRRGGPGHRAGERALVGLRDGLRAQVAQGRHGAAAPDAGDLGGPQPRRRRRQPQRRQLRRRPEEAQLHEASLAAAEGLQEPRQQHPLRRDEQQAVERKEAPDPAAVEPEHLPQPQDLGGREGADAEGREDRGADEPRGARRAPQHAPQRLGRGAPPQHPAAVTLLGEVLG
mmetsp:Transcript_117684/g.319441  ORF Transcript_117684/g.319441 Transcript_117684/m.319441 type:complete len:204 (-) Transcript_117684:629-1240(-)